MSWLLRAPLEILANRFMTDRENNIRTTINLLSHEDTFRALIDERVNAVQNERNIQAPGEVVNLSAVISQEIEAKVRTAVANIRDPNNQVPEAADRQNPRGPQVPEAADRQNPRGPQVPGAADRQNRRGPQVPGAANRQNSRGTLEPDLYAMMMMSKVISWEWLLGIFIFFLQGTLAGIIIYEQTQKDFLDTDMKIPFRVPIVTLIVQGIAIFLSIITQNEFLSGLRTICILPFGKDNNDGTIKWYDVCSVEVNDQNLCCWIIRVFVPNILKALQGLAVLVASFIVIVQLEKTVDVLKDYSALFIVSSVDNFAFDHADQGYFGQRISDKVDKTRDTILPDNQKKVRHRLISLWMFLNLVAFSGFGYIVAGQVNGRYFKQAFPFCNQDLTSGLKKIGDNTCDYAQGYGTNIRDCGWDGGDCKEINERYPECFVDNLTLLGDEKCNNGAYNSKVCGFDNGDCMDFNEMKQKQYQNCSVENIGWISDGICNGREYMVEDCGLDGGDCENCKVNDMDKIGDGKCDGGEYNTADCSFDGGDCKKLNKEKKEKYPFCNVTNIGWIGDGVCNGREYASDSCQLDGSDCENCKVDDMDKIGDGECDSGEYNTQECSFDGGDCLKTNDQKRNKYPFCNVEYIGWIGDGVCNGREYMAKDCGHDGGDCDECTVSLMSWQSESRLGDGVCDGGDYNTKICGYDGGDCIQNNTDLQKWYKDCSVKNPWSVGNDNCEGENNVIECGYDGGDCDDCPENRNKTLLGNGYCDGKVYNIAECFFDHGDCNELNFNKTSQYPSCKVKNIGWINDGICDGFEYASQDCDMDGGDCKNSCDVLEENLVADGFCDEEYNVDGCFFDRYDCVPSMKVFGEIPSGRWVGGLKGRDGFIYSIPSHGSQILRVNPKLNTTTSGPEVNIKDDGWKGGVIGTDGIIYGVPFEADSILRYNITSEKVSFIEQGHSLLKTLHQFMGGVLAENGNIYFIPSHNRRVLKFDPSNTIQPLTEIGEDLKGFHWKMMGGVLGSDGNIYGIPLRGSRVLKIDIENDSTSFIGDEYIDKWKWTHGASAKDGNIYACPSVNNRILKIDVENQITELVGPDLGNETEKWSGFVEGKDDFLYGIPFNSNKLLRFNPMNHTATLILVDEKMTRKRKWDGGVLADNGYIYGIPRESKKVLSIAPLKFRP